MHFQKTWRWFGSYDTIALSDIKQTGATGIVTALHHIPAGEVWPVEEIKKRQNIIRDAGLEWTVVESVPVHENIKKQAGNFKAFINNYKQSIQNLGECDIHTVCYNFMPLTDWTRTQVDYPLDDGSTALRFDFTAYVAFELFVLQRPGAEKLYTAEQKNKAEHYLNSLTEEEISTLTETILLGLPGDEEITLESFRNRISKYDNITDQDLRNNLYYFLKEIIPVAEEYGVRMAIHPDDPPRPLFGLPRVVSTESDARQLLEAVGNDYNGLTFCTGSYGAHPSNDLQGMAERLGNRIHFIHLRSVQREPDGSFYEANHMEGDANMYSVMRALVNEQKRRVSAGREDVNIPMRPDHGHQILDDLNRKSYPGYSGLGRLRGLAELRGLEIGIRKSLADK